jgi:predicted DsbA family dithiol-disulfide isomerase
MRVTVAFDVLSHWCLAAWAAFESARDRVGAANVELLLAPILNGFPMGVPPEHERWFYGRGSLVYSKQLRSDWYESDRTTTLWANAAVVAASALGADFEKTSHRAMTAAMEHGGLLGRRIVAVETVAQLTGIDAKRIDEQIDASATGRALNAGNAALEKWGCVERPSWRIENGIGDFTIMQGIWRVEPIVACIDALAADEKAYAAAGGPPA